MPSGEQGGALLTCSPGLQLLPCFLSSSRCFLHQGESVAEASLRSEPGCFWPSVCFESFLDDPSVSPGLGATIGRLPQVVGDSGTLGLGPAALGDPLIHATDPGKHPVPVRQCCPAFLDRAS